MLEIWAVILFISVPILYFVWNYISQKTSNSLTVPGLKPSDPKEGNIPDIGKAGSLHEFLLSLHARFGDIASFWYGKQQIVSTASPELFRGVIHTFDRPPILFQLFEPIFTQHSITYANSMEGRKRRNNYDMSYSHGAVSLNCDLFVQLASEMCSRFASLPPEEHIPLYENMFAMGLKAITITSFGPIFHNQQELHDFHKDYETTWGELERHMLGDYPDPGSDRIKAFEQSKKSMYDAVRRAIVDRRERPPPEGEELLIDWLMHHASCEDEALADGVTYVIAGAHTSALSMTWGLYYLALNQDMQERAYQELVEVLGDQDLTTDVIPQLVYIRQVIDETLRCSVLAPYTARFHEEDMTLGGHVIPAGTAVIQAVGVVLLDEKLWPDPHKFDPERFSPENRQSIPRQAFEPFGFAGKRKCPGYRFAYAEATAFLSVLLRKFRFKLVPGQVVTPVHGLVTKPAEEIWVTLERRK